MSFFKKYKNRMIVAAVTIILIVIIGMTSSERDKLTGIEKVIGNILSPVEKVFFNVSKSISDGFSTIGNIGKIKEENVKLKSN